MGSSGKCVLFGVERPEFEHEEAHVAVEPASEFLEDLGQWQAASVGAIQETLQN